MIVDINPFRLSSKFVAAQRQRPVEWGFGALSWFTYKRTYSRNGESWHDTCKRVIEGMYTILKWRCMSMRLPFDETRAQGDAQEAYRRMFVFKWLPPGRGLWMMGTDFVYEEGGSALNNPLEENTRIHTKEHGLVSIGDLRGKRVHVLASTHFKHGEAVKSSATTWVETTISEPEYQPCVELELRDRSRQTIKIVCSENHRWYRKEKAKGPWERISSLDLSEGDYLPVAKPPAHAHINKFAILHGLFFGDGTRSNGELHLFGYKIDVAADIVPNLIRDSNHPDAKVIRNCPYQSWSKLPRDTTVGYLKGFVAGYIAADGHVSGNRVHITSSRLHELEAVREICDNLGYRSSLVLHTKAGAANNVTEDRKPLWSLRLYARDLTRDMILRDDHRDKFDGIKHSKRDDYRVVAIRSVGYKKVLCAEVPDYENFVIEGNLVTSNCGFVSTRDININFNEPFCWMFEMLMLGVGIGFDTLGAKCKLTFPTSTKAGGWYQVADTRQGWAGALRIYLRDRIAGFRPTFDYSKVRPYGTPIVRFGGTASGPEPLRLMMRHLDAAFARAQGHVTSELITDIANIIGTCVVAGNVRRSAQIALGSSDDRDFAALKSKTRRPQDHEEPTGDSVDWAEDWLYGTRPWMYASNNSLVMGAGDELDYAALTPRIVENGEPGFLWLDTCREYGRLKDGHDPEADYRAMGTNPCSEQTLENYELCCLVETFPAKHTNLADYQQSLRYAYLYAKIVTCLPTHSERTNAVMRANARIGCSMSGITQAMDKFGTREFFDMCDKSYQYIDSLDKEYSRWLAAPRSIKMTSVKPSGTVSLLAGATPGCHDDHSNFTIRRIRVATSNPIHEHAEECGYYVEPDMHQPNTMVIEFPTVTQGNVRAKADVSMWEQFERVAQLQHYWADNQVSATVTFNASEIQDIPKVLELYQDRLKSISLLPNIEDSGAYDQMPYEAISEETYREMLAAVDEARLMGGAVQHDRTEKFCDGESCEI